MEAVRFLMTFAPHAALGKPITIALLLLGRRLTAASRTRRSESPHKLLSTLRGRPRSKRTNYSRSE